MTSSTASVAGEYLSFTLGDEHYGVDIDLHRLAPPALTAVTARADGAVEVVFDQWMSVDSVRAGLAVRAGAQVLPGTVAGVDEQRAGRAQHDHRVVPEQFAPVDQYAVGDLGQHAVLRFVVSTMQRGRPGSPEVIGRRDTAALPGSTSCSWGPAEPREHEKNPRREARTAAGDTHPM